MPQSRTRGWLETLAAWVFIALPHHLLSRLVFHLTRLRGPLAPWMIRWFIRTYRVDMSEAANDQATAFPTFNQFFTRELRDGARPVVEGQSRLASPVDGTVSQFGTIQHDHLFQAKNQCYSVEELLGGDRLLANMFSGGRFATIYLAPYNYHRIHMPLDGQLKKMVHVPGRLFSVAPWTVRRIPRLFARNERVVCLFSTAAGPMAMILVGAINVAAIETTWHGLVTPPRGRRISSYDYSHGSTQIDKGQEMGRFNMGSTVILLTTDQVEWCNLAEQHPVRMGQEIGLHR
jgi:phosphatidylserine decarboxylase